MDCKEIARLAGTKAYVVEETLVQAQHGNIEYLDKYKNLEFDFDNIPLSVAKDLIIYFYQRGLRTEEGCRLTNLPYLPYDKYYRDTHVFTGRKKTTPEKSAVQRLQEEIGGKREVSTPAGNVDLLTDGELVECKSVKSWKHGIGQLLVYSMYFPCDSLRLHLYGTVSDALHEEIAKHCNRWGIKLSFD